MTEANGYLQEVPMTDAEKLEMYRRNCTFDELAKMHIELMKHIGGCPTCEPHYFAKQREQEPVVHKATAESCELLGIRPRLSNYIQSLRKSNEDTPRGFYIAMIVICSLGLAVIGWITYDGWEHIVNSLK